jgi:hypothetical protein
MRKFSFGKSYFSTLVLAKNSNNKISKNTLKVLNAAKQLNQPVFSILKFCIKDLSTSCIR